MLDPIGFDSGLSMAKKKRKRTTLDEKIKKVLNSLFEADRIKQIHICQNIHNFEKTIRGRVHSPCKTDQEDFFRLCRPKNISSINRYHFPITF